MFRIAICAAIAAMAAAMTGCAAGGGNCNACDGGYGYVPPHSPMEAARNFRKSLVCGNGCGEVYYGDYINNPPDCCDTCDNTVQCTPPIQPRPGFLFFALTGLYGKRAPGYHDDCCDLGCDDCGGGEVIDSGCSSCNGGQISYAGGGGCASCQAGGYSSSSYVSNEIQRRAPLSRSTSDIETQVNRRNSRIIRR